MATLTEAQVEAVLLDQLQSMGYACLNDSASGPDGPAPEREAYADTFLSGRLRAAIARLNPQIPEDAREDALRRVPALADLDAALAEQILDIAQRQREADIEHHR